MAKLIPNGNIDGNIKYMKLYSALQLYKGRNKEEKRGARSGGTGARAGAQAGIPPLQTSPFIL